MSTSGIPEKFHGTDFDTVFWKVRTPTSHPGGGSTPRPRTESTGGWLGVRVRVRVKVRVGVRVKVGIGVKVRVRVRVGLRVRIRVGVRVRIRVGLRVRIRVGVRVSFRIRVRVRFRVGVRVKLRLQVRVSISSLKIFCPCHGTGWQMVPAPTGCPLPLCRGLGKTPDTSLAKNDGGIHPKRSTQGCRGTPQHHCAPPDWGGQPPHPSPPARSPQCDMQKLTVDELKRLLYDTFCEHLSMKDIENIIMTEEESHMGTAEECPVDVESECQPAGAAKSHHQPRRHGDGTCGTGTGGLGVWDNTPPLWLSPLLPQPAPASRSGRPACGRASSAPSPSPSSSA